MTVLDQFNRLRQQTPHVGLQCVQNENSPYCQYTEKSRNCTMTFASYESEDYGKKRGELIEQMKREGNWGKWFSSTYPEVITVGL